MSRTVLLVVGAAWFLAWLGYCAFCIVVCVAKARAGLLIDSVLFILGALAAARLAIIAFEP